MLESFGILVRVSGKNRFQIDSRQVMGTVRGIEHAVLALVLNVRFLVQGLWEKTDLKSILAN